MKLSPERQAEHDKRGLPYTTGGERDLFSNTGKRLTYHQFVFAQVAAGDYHANQQTIEELKGLLKECRPYLETALRRNLEQLKDADPESVFYGEDIMTAPLLGRIERALNPKEQAILTTGNKEEE